MECVGFKKEIEADGNVVLYALAGYDIENEIIPNAVRYLRKMGYDCALLFGLNGVDLHINPYKSVEYNVERWKETLYKFTGIEL